VRHIRPRRAGHAGTRGNPTTRYARSSDAGGSNTNYARHRECVEGQMPRLNLRPAARSSFSRASRRHPARVASQMAECRVLKRGGYARRGMKNRTRSAIAKNTRTGGKFSVIMDEFRPEGATPIKAAATNHPRRAPRARGMRCGHRRNDGCEPPSEPARRIRRRVDHEVSQHDATRTGDQGPRQVRCGSLISQPWWPGRHSVVGPQARDQGAARQRTAARRRAMRGERRNAPAGGGGSEQPQPRERGVLERSGWH